MFIRDTDFGVSFSDFAQRHFCKSFACKHKKGWVETRRMIVFNLERAFLLSQQTDLIDLIRFSVGDNRGIFKLSFRIAGTNFSPKSSGNRVVFALDNISTEIEILLVYGKDHISKGQSETQWLLSLIKANFSKYKQICK